MSTDTHTDLRRPNFLVIGAARSGTTALTYMLQQHPEIFICEPKEPHFMAFAAHPPQFVGPGDDLLLNQRAVTKWPAYRRLFRDANGATAIGEGSVSTLYYPDEAIPNIREYLPGARLIAILRNPIERAYSSYLYMRGRGYEPLEDFAAALADEERRRAAGWHHIWHYQRLSMYADSIRAFRAAFGADHLRVYLFEELLAEGHPILSDLFEFLDVNPDFQPQNGMPVNRSGLPRSRLWTAANRRLDRMPRVKDGLKAVVPIRLRERLRNASLTQPPMPADCRELLRDRFREDIHQLEALLDRDLSAWLQ